MTVKKINLPLFITILSVVAAVSVFMYSYNSQTKLIGKIFTSDEIENTEYIVVKTVIDNMYPKSYQISGKSEIKQYYKWIGSLRYKEILSGKHNLEPGTEFSLIPFDSSKKQLFTMSYSKSKKQLEIKQKIYILSDDISTDLEKLIGTK